MNSFIPWVGGKSKLLWIINKMAPDHYSRFIDVFGGSGTVTMSRPIQQGCMEVYNDFNSNLTNLFCCVKNRPLCLISDSGLSVVNQGDHGAYNPAIWNQYRVCLVRKLKLYSI